MGSPFIIPSSHYERCAVHKILFNEIVKVRSKLQRQSDLKYGKNKYTVSFIYASKKLGEILR